MVEDRRETKCRKRKMEGRSEKIREEKGESRGEQEEQEF